MAMYSHSHSSHHNSPYDYMSMIEYSRRYFINIEQEQYSCKTIDKVDGKAWHDNPEGIISFLIRKKIINALGNEDWVYYHLIYRSYWWMSWANDEPGHANIPKYVRSHTPGATLSEKIYKKFEKDNRRGISALVVAMLTPEEKQKESLRGTVTEAKHKPKLEFWYCSCDVFVAHHRKYGGLIDDSRWDQVEIGYPSTIFTRPDIFRTHD